MTGSEADWRCFRQLRNYCTSQIKTSKAEFFLSATTENLNNPRKFWKVIKSLSASGRCNELPPCISTASGTVSDRSSMLNSFNEHFVSCGLLFDSVSTSTSAKTVDFDLSFAGINPPFCFSLFSVDEVYEALCNLDSKKPAGPDNLEPFFLKTGAEFIAPPLTYLFNLTLSTNVIPKIWKSAYVLPLLKGGRQFY